MSIGAEPISEQAIADQSSPASRKGGPPPKRTAVAASDVVAQPEAR